MSDSTIIVAGNGDELIQRMNHRVWNAQSNSIKIPELATSLIILSGRRPAELLSGCAIISEGDSEMSVFFKENPTAKELEIPLLCETPTFLRGMALLRELQGEACYTRLEVKKKYQSAINYHVERNYHFVNNEDKVSANDLRYLYCFMAYHKYQYQLTYQHFVSWMFNLGRRMAVLPSPEIVIQGAKKKIVARNRVEPPKRWLEKG